MNRRTKPKFRTAVCLTEGTPWRVLLIYAAPIVLSYLLQQIYVLTDAIICGQVLTGPQVAGVNDTYPLTFIFLQFAFGCTAGFSVITAQCVGRGDHDGIRRSFAVQIALTLAISVVLTAMSVSMLPWMLRVLHVTPDNPAVYDAAYAYCLVIFIGIAAQMGYNFICGVLRAYGDSITPLIFLGFSTVLNIGLDLLFLVPLRMGPRGAAIATVLAQLISVIACAAYAVRKYPALRVRKSDFAIDWDAIGAHLRNGIPLGLQFSILAIGIIIMQSAVVQFDLTDTGAMVSGTPAQNGFGAASKLINFLMSAFNGLGSAILGFNAQNYGKGQLRRIRQGTGQALVIMLVCNAVCLAVGLLLTINGAYQYIFMSADKISPESLRFGNTYLYVDIGLYALLGYLIVVRSAVQGIDRPGYVLGAGIGELVTRSAICLLLPQLLNGGAINAKASTAAFIGLSLGDPGAWLAASLVLLPATIRDIAQIERGHMT